jgi:hypothetical protein
MAVERPVHPGLADLVEVAVALERERAADRPRGALHRRDREIGRALAGLRDRPERQLPAWARRIAEAERAGSTEPSVGQRVLRAQRAAAVVIVLAGLLLGWAVATAVFWYDGTHPVNVIHVLAVFVGLQLVLLLLLVLAAAKRDLAWFSPARLLGMATRLLPEPMREAIAPAIGTAEAHHRVFARVQKWTLLQWAQLLAIAFNIGAIACYLRLVFFSDLAFAWSTTVRVEVETVHAICGFLALPWAWGLPDAVPSLELVRWTQYYRLEEARLGLAGTRSGEAVDPAEFGGWWPFVLMAIVVYGLFPRAVAYGVTVWRQRAAIRWTIRHTPGAAAVLDRLNNAYVETRATNGTGGAATVAAAGEDNSNGDDAAVGEAVVPGTPQRVRAVLNWAAVPIDDAAVRAVVGVPQAEVVHCGGSKSLAEDRACLQRLAEHGGEGGVAVVTKGWEPPLLELMDFLGEMRLALGDGVPIAVTPIGLDRDGGVRPVDEAHLRQWTRRVRATGDAWLSVTPMAPGESGTSGDPGAAPPPGAGGGGSS